MAGEIILASKEFYALISGCVMAVVFGALVFLIKFWTPGFVFLKAKMKKTPLFWVKYKNGLGEFLPGKQDTPGSMEVKNIGSIMLTEGSHILEKNSNVLIYEGFGEYGASVPREYASIITQMKEKGLPITNFNDYKKFLDLSTNKDIKEAYLSKLKPHTRAVEESLINQFEKEGMNLLPYRSYQVHELQHMFPNNISPVYVQVKADALANIKARRERLQSQLLIAAGVAVLFALLGAAIAWKILQSGAVGTAANVAGGVVEAIPG